MSGAPETSQALSTEAKKAGSRRGFPSNKPTAVLFQVISDLSLVPNVSQPFEGDHSQTPKQASRKTKINHGTILG